MLSCKMLGKVLNKMKKLRDCLDLNDMTGGLCLLLVGDMEQLPPVGGKALYSSQAASHCPLSLAGHTAWRRLDFVVMLKQSHRAGNCATLRAFLENGREEGFGSERARQTLRNRKNITDSAGVAPGNPRIPSEAPYVTPGNHERVEINQKILGHISKNQVPLYLFRAQIHLSKKTPLSKPQWKGLCQKFYQHMVDSETERYPPSLVVFSGCPVMVTQNVAVASGVANGTKGKISRFCWQDGTTFVEKDVKVNSVLMKVKIPSLLPISIIVRVDDSLPFYPPPSPESFPLEREFPIVERRASIQVRHPAQGSKSKVSISLSQFPLVPRFALTCHKVQGDTLRSGVVVAYWKTPESYKPDGKKRKRAPVNPQYAYVVCSRVQTIDKLFVLHELDRATGESFHRRADAKRDEARLQVHHEHTMQMVANFL